MWYKDNECFILFCVSKGCWVGQCYYCHIFFDTRCLQRMKVILHNKFSLIPEGIPSSAKAQVDRRPSQIQIRLGVRLRS